MAEADVRKPEAVTWVRAAAVGLGVAAAAQTAALGLAYFAFVAARPFDRPAQQSVDRERTLNHTPLSGASDRVLCCVDR